MQAIDKYGAVERNRTSDLLITNQLLYQLSYNGDDEKVYQPAILAESRCLRAS